MSRADQPTSVRFPRETLEFLRVEAGKRRWGVSLLVRDVIEQWRQHILKTQKAEKKK